MNFAVLFWPVYRHGRHYLYYGRSCIMAAAEVRLHGDLNDREEHVLEESYGNSSLTRRFVVVGDTVRKGTQRKVGPPLQKFLKVSPCRPRHGRHGSIFHSVLEMRYDVPAC